VGLWTAVSSSYLHVGLRLGPT